MELGLVLGVGVEIHLELGLRLGLGPQFGGPGLELGLGGVGVVLELGLELGVGVEIHLELGLRLGGRLGMEGMELGSGIHWELELQFRGLGWVEIEVQRLRELEQGRKLLVFGFLYGLWLPQLGNQDRPKVQPEVLWGQRAWADPEQQASMLYLHEIPGYSEIKRSKKKKKKKRSKRKRKMNLRGSIKLKLRIPNTHTPLLKPRNRGFRGVGGGSIGIIHLLLLVERRRDKQKTIAVQQRIFFFFSPGVWRIWRK